MRLFRLSCFFILWLNMNESLQQDGIKCAAPVIENGFVPGDIQEYREHEVLNFQCDPQYKCAEDRQSKCIKIGTKAEWSPTPACEEIKCELKLPPLEGTRYEPATRNVFSPGDTVRVLCGDKHWIVNHQTTSAESTCQSDGRWNMRPLCQGSFCTKLNIENAAITYNNKNSYTHNEQVRYACRNGNRNTFTITCIQGVWTGVKSCSAQQCPLIHVDNNVQVIGDPERANNGDVVRFRCKSSSEVLEGSAEMYCDANGEWSGIVPRCTGIKCRSPVIENGFVPGDIQEYKEHEVLNFQCNPQYKRAEDRQSKCIKVGTKAEWSPTPACEQIKCELKLPPLEGTRYEPATRNVFSPGATVRVLCGDKHWIVNHQTTSAETTCQSDGRWNIRPLCQGSFCTKLNIENAEITYNNKNSYTHNEQVRYACRNGNRNTFTITCIQGVWTGVKSCSAYCDKLNNEKQSMNFTSDKDIYMDGDVIEYQCIIPDVAPGGNATCVDGQWIKTVECKDVTCEVDIMHPALTATGLPPANETVQVGHKLQFDCSSDFQLDGSKEIECLETGQWSSPFPTCL